MKHFTRRDFLKLCGSSSIAAILAACGVTPTPTAMPAPTSTALPTNTPLPTATATLTSTPVPTSTATVTATGTPRIFTLRDYAQAIGFEMGVALSRHDPRQMDIYRDQFNTLLITDLEWQRMEPTRGRIIYSSKDANSEDSVAFAMSNKMRIISSNIVYWGQYPAWLKGSKNLSPVDARNILTERVRELFLRFKGKIDIWMVANEFRPSSWGQKEDILLDKLGEEYIDLAFQVAREGDPHATLIYNDTDNHLKNSPTTNLTKQLIVRLRSKSLIDGVGLQMHLEGSTPPSKTEVLQVMKEYEFPLYVTEFDVNMRNVPGSQAERNQKQARIYADMLESALESGACRSFTVYNVGDKYSWLENPGAGKRYSPNADATPFDDNLQPKPAYFAMLEVLQKFAQQKKP